MNADNHSQTQDGSGASAPLITLGNVWSERLKKQRLQDGPQKEQSQIGNSKSVVRPVKRLRCPLLKLTSLSLSRNNQNKDRT